MAPARKANDYNVAIMGTTSGYVLIGRFYARDVKARRI